MVISGDTKPLFTVSAGKAKPSTFATANSDRKDMKKIFLIFTVMIAVKCNVHATVTVTAATGGSSLCYYDWTPLGPITISEGAKGDFTVAAAPGKTFILSAPKNYLFKKNTGSISFVQGKNVTDATLTVTDTTLIVTVTCAATTTNGDGFTISGLYVKARYQTPVAASDSIKRLSTNAGTYTIVGATYPQSLIINFGILTQAPDFTFLSASVTQTNLTYIIPGDINNEIIGIKVENSGYCKSVNTFDFTLRTTGTTNSAADISTAKLWFTGNSPEFATTRLTGSFANPATTFHITGTDTLYGGTNYFWLTYDVPATAPTGDVVDGRCAYITVNGVQYSPANVTVSGTRTIGITTIGSAAAGNWNDTLTWANHIVPNAGNNVIINAGHVVNLTSNAQCVDLTLENGGTKSGDGGILILNAKELKIYGDLIIEEGSLPGKIISSGSSKLNIQDIGGKQTLVIPDSIIKLQKLTINRANGAYSNHTLNLSANPPADSMALILNKGVLEFANDSIFLNLTALGIQNYIPCSDSSYVDGKVKRATVKAKGMVYFPIGDGGICRMLAAGTVKTSPDNTQAQFFREIPRNYEYYNAVYFPNGVWKEYYWKHAVDPGENPSRKFFFADSDFPGLTNNDVFSAMAVATNDGTWHEPWDKIVGGGYSVDTIANYVNVPSNSSNLKYWTFASTRADVPLPIELLYFYAKNEGEKNNISWATASETNNNFFTVEKSYDLTNFIPVAELRGAGNSNSELFYETEDRETFSESDVCYYRLKQTDFDGKFTFSEIVAVKKPGTKPEIKAFNSNGNIIVNINQAQSSQVEISVLDISGRLIDRMDASIEKGDNRFSFQANLKPSVFFIYMKNKSTGEETIIKGI